MASACARAASSAVWNTAVRPTVRRRRALLSRPRSSARRAPPTIAQSSLRFLRAARLLQCFPGATRPRLTAPPTPRAASLACASTSRSSVVPRACVVAPTARGRSLRAARHPRNSPPHQRGRTCASPTRRDDRPTMACASLIARPTLRCAAPRCSATPRRTPAETATTTPRCALAEPPATAPPADAVIARQAIPARSAVACRAGP